MTRVLTNNVSLQYAIETSIGVLPGSPIWKLLEPNNIGSFGATITTVPRRPISRSRGRRKGTVTDLDSTPEFPGDLTMESHADFLEGFMFAEFTNVEFDLKLVTLPPTATVTTDVFNVDSVSVLLGGKMVWAAAGGRSLVFAKGYAIAANNGMHELAADVASTDTTVGVTSTLATETPPTNASLEVAGIRIGDSDLTLTVTGSLATLVSAADVADWSVLGIKPGQFIHIGSNNGTTGAAHNALKGTVTDDSFGYARIASISSATLNLDKLDENLATSDNTGEGDTDIMFGRMARNVETTDDADDNRYLERSYQFEGTFPDLGGTGTDEYEYAIGNFANEMAMNVPLTDKGTIDWGFVGTNVDDITDTRKTGAATARNPLRTVALNTSSNVASLSTDLITLVSDVCFKSLTLTIKNNVSAEKCIGTLGAVFMNAGQFEVDLEGQMLFTNKSITNAIKNNTTVTFASILFNEDGALAWDLPSLTMGDGTKEFPVDQSVLVNISGATFTDSTFGHDLAVSLFAQVPTLRP